MLKGGKICMITIRVLETAYRFSTGAMRDIHKPLKKASKKTAILLRMPRAQRSHANLWFLTDLYESRDTYEISSIDFM